MYLALRIILISFFFQSAQLEVTHAHIAFDVTDGLGTR
jgi:hypothetical protein